MRKAVLIFLFCFSLPLFSGDRSGNGGNGYEGHLQRIAAARIYGALSHEKNKGIMTTAETKTLSKIIQAGVPLKVVLPEKVEKDRFELLSDEDKEFRVVQEKATRKILIQWDEKDLRKITEDGKNLPDELVQNLMSAILSYAFAIGSIDRDDKSGISKKLHYPPADPTLLLASSAYRYDFHRRLKEMQARHQDLAMKIRRAGAGDPKLQKALVYQENKVQIIEKLLTYTFKLNDETWADNLDLVERELIKHTAEVEELLK